MVSKFANFKKIINSFFLKKTILGKYIKSRYKLDVDHRDFVLNAFEEKVVSDLRQNGIHITQLDHFLNAEQYQEFMNSVKVIYDSDPQYSNKKFLEYYRGGEFPQQIQYFSQNDRMIEIALNESLLKIIGNYLGVKSHLCYLELNKSIVSNAKTKQLSQKPHRDPCIFSCIKVFVYYNDVDENAGPFNFIKKTHYNGKLADLYPNTKMNSGSYYGNDEEQMGLLAYQPTECVGTRGTIIICDTSGWHFGGNSITKSRKMSTFVYYPVFDNIKSRLFIDGDTNKLSAFQKAFLCHQ